MIDFLKDLKNAWDEITQDAPIAPKMIFDKTDESIMQEIEQIINLQRTSKN